VLLETLGALQCSYELDRANFEDSQVRLNPFGIVLEFAFAVLLLAFR
jgi:hypothetical protein